MRAGRFRSDLFFRLNVVPLTVPPLRERPADIPLLVTYFLSRFAKRFGRRIDGVSRDTMDRLVRYQWPGNVRELQNIVERAVVLSTGTLLKVDFDILPIAEAAASPSRPADGWAAAAPATAFVSLDDAERRHIEAVLSQTRGVIEGPTGAAKNPRPPPEYASQPNEEARCAAAPATKSRSHDGDPAAAARPRHFVATKTISQHMIRSK